MTTDKKHGKLSIILPSFNEEDAVPLAAAKLREALTQEGIPYQLLFVDDGSRDGTWNAICACRAEDENVCGIKFSRNFGKESAMFAGLAHASGDCCAVMDCDLQHPVETVIEMYRLWQDGYEVVEGIKTSRGKESLLHKCAARGFYRLMSSATSENMDNTSDFKLLDRKVVDALNALPERGVFFRALSFWVGFRRTQVEYRVLPRTVGETKWSGGKLIAYAIRNLLSFSSAPLKFVSWSGGVFVLLSLILAVQTLVRKFSGHALEGFTTVILVQLLASGLILICLGIVGSYCARIYEEIKGRPRFIISEQIGDQNEENRAH